MGHPGWMVPINRLGSTAAVGLDVGFCVCVMAECDGVVLNGGVVVDVEEKAGVP